MTAAVERIVRSKIKIMAFLPALLVMAALAPLKAQTDSILGEWQDPTGSTLRIDRCGQELCIWIAGISRNASSVTDIHNPNASLRQRPLCGLKIGTGFQPEQGDRASDGTLYDPKSGNTYHGEMKVEGQQLRLRGYVGLTWFGRTEIWKRPAEPVTVCKASLGNF
jgi:uncharacterized protein (DUF2147 family)